MNVMRALTIWQPWASLIAVGAKHVETRGWAAPADAIGQRIAIHAAVEQKALGLCDEEPFRRYVQQPLPLGAVVCTARLVRCTEMTEATIQQLAEQAPEEHAFGLYEPGRFAWRLVQVEPLAVPVPFKGKQKLWWLPREVLDESQGRLV